MILKRKKILIWLAAALLLSAALSACGSKPHKAASAASAAQSSSKGSEYKTSEEGINSNYYIYRSAANKFNINFPKTWRAEEDSDTSVTFTAPGNGSSSYGEKLKVTVEDLTGKIDDLSMLKFTSLRAISKTVEDYQQEDFDDVIINKLQGEMVIYSGRQDGRDLKWYTVFFIGNDRTYTVAYSTDADKFDSHLEDIEAIVNTFKLQ